MERPKEYRHQLKIYLLFVLAAVNVCIWYAVFAEDREGKLTVAFLDIGQGDAIFIEAPNGAQALIDGGPPSGKVLSELGRMMPFYDRTIDVVIATHPDQDHIGGLPEVFKRYRVGVLFEPGISSDNGDYQAMEQAGEKTGVKKILARAGMKIHLDKNTTLEIFYPDRDLPGKIDTNRASVVARLTYGNESFLFTGDLPQAEEKHLVQEGGIALRSNVLKFGHHGSRTSTSEIFLKNVAPEYGLVSAGKDNRYGHPHKEVLGLAAKYRVPVLRTDTQGRIVFTTDGNSLSYATQK
ncbi:MAG: MBL fold metallo-hydrolase [Parcubacteria group bacterium]|nr:MBL fold metallo-hydrolase [Parcubacteria group bacterium]